MSQLKDVLSLIKTTLAGNAEIDAWCGETFGRAPMIFVGIDPRKPPQLEQNCPMICVITDGRRRERNQSYLEHTIHIGCAIKSDTQERTGNTVVFKGIELIDDFANLVEAVITKAFNQNGYASTQEAVFGDDVDPSFFKAHWSYNIRCQSIIS
jgi:hypothetical protein